MPARKNRPGKYVAPKNTPRCTGRLAYETMAGVFRVHRDGVYSFRCQECGEHGTGDGSARLHSEIGR